MVNKLGYEIKAKKYGRIIIDLGMVYPHGQCERDSKKRTSKYISPGTYCKHCSSNSEGSQAEGISLVHMAGFDNDYIESGKGISQSPYHTEPAVNSESEHQKVKAEAVQEKGIHGHGQRPAANQYAIDIFYTDKAVISMGCNLVSRHSSEHGIRPERGLTGLFLELADFLVAAHELLDVVLRQRLPLKNRRHVNEGGSQENEHADKMRKKLFL